MSEFTLINLLALPIGLRLLRFVEPCSIGSSLVFIKYVEGQSATASAGAGGVIWTRSRQALTALASNFSSRR